MKHIALTIAGVSLLALTGCLNQEQVDVKMGKGCEAALQTQFGTDKVKDVTFVDATADIRPEGSFRRINMTYVEIGSFDQTPKPAQCLFSEQWGAGKSSHTAVLEQLNAHNTVYGKEGGVVKGPLEEFLKLTEAAAKAMGQ